MDYTKDEIFIGPLPEDVYDSVTNECGLFRQDRMVELTARALYGQKKAKEFAAELEKINEENAIDGLTRVYKKEVTFQELDNRICGLEMNRRKTDQKDGLLVIFFDVEEFKKINDRNWSEGEEALEAVGMGLISIARGSRGDFPGRIGGDEFVLVVPFNEDEVSKVELLTSLEERIRHQAPYRSKNFPSLQWHHAFYENGDTRKSMLERAYPKGESKGFARRHSQNEQEYTQTLMWSLKAVV
jgi:diguanylate cyclase (GGDEF)-like protein